MTSTEYVRMNTRRGSDSTTVTSTTTILRVLGVSILALGLVSLTLQGYGIGQQKPVGNEIVPTEPVAEEQSPLAQSSLLRKDQNGGGDEATTTEEDELPTDDDTAHCYDERDWGLVASVKASKRVFCGNSKNTPQTSTRVTYYNVSRAGFKSTVFHKLVLDLRGAKVFKPIKSIAQDGRRHDPRFKFSPDIVQCACDELVQFAAKEKKTNNQTMQVWYPSLATLTATTDPPSTLCAPSDDSPYQVEGAHVEIKEKTLLIVRKDDHNPFFQISNALNAWILRRVLGWDKLKNVRVIHFDGGFPSPIDALHKNLLTPTLPLINAGKELQNRQVEFHDDVAIVPYEVSGPMMQHLNDYEPCQASKMLKDFKFEAMQSMNLPALPTKRTQITVTVITRRNYGGRKVQRTWRNEKEILDQMRELYKVGRGSMPIVFQSIDFVDLSLQDQMWIMQTSDVVIGMHGAGMVNVLWTRPETLVIEIFPKKRFRWGYRNLCQYTGCDWHEFRGGKDTGKGDNNSHKTIPWDEWHGFFSPLFQDTLARIGKEKR